MEHFHNAFEQLLDSFVVDNSFFFNDIRKFIFPGITEPIISECKKKFEESPNPLLSIEPLRNCISYKSNDFKKAIILLNNSKENNLLLSTFVYCSTLSYLLQYEELQSAENNTLISFILQLLHTKFHEKNATFVLMIFSSFIFDKINANPDEKSLCIIAKNVSTDDKFCFVILVKALKVSIVMNNKEVFNIIKNKLIECISDTKRNNIINDEDLIDIICEHCRAFDCEVLEIVKALQKNNKCTHLSKFFSYLPNEFNNSVIKSVPMPTKTENDGYFFHEDIYIKKIREDARKRSFEEIISYVHRTNHDFNEEEQNNCSNKDSAFFRAIMQLLYNDFNENEHENCNLFFQSFNEIFSCIDDGVIAQIIILIKLCGFLTTIPEETFKIILKSKTIFNPEVTIFTENEGFDVANALRTDALDQILKFCPQESIEMIEQFKDKPFFIAELLLRVTALNDSSCLFCDDFLVFVRNEIAALDSLIEDGVDFYVVKAGKQCIYIFIINFIIHNDFPDDYFQSKYLKECMLLLMEDNTQRKSVFEELNKIRSINGIKKTIGLIASIINPENTIQVCDLCNFIIGKTSNEKDNADSLRFLILYIIYYIEHNKMPEVYYLGIMSIFHILIKSSSLSIDHKQRKKMAKLIIERQTRDAYIEQMIIYSLISGSQDNYSGIIKFRCYDALILAFSVASNISNESLQTMAAKALQSCKSSPSNVYQAHKGELDILMLMFIYNYPNDFVFRDCSFKNLKTPDPNKNTTLQSLKNTGLDMFLDLFFIIASTVSSVPVVNKMFKIMTPDHDKGVCQLALPFAEKYIEQYPKMSSISFNQINITSPMVFFAIIDETFRSFFDSVISFKLFYDSTDENNSTFIIFDVLDDHRNNILRLEVRDGKLILATDQEVISETPKKLASNVWNSISISFKGKGNNVSTSINAHTNKIEKNYKFSVDMDMKAVIFVGSEKNGQQNTGNDDYCYIMKDFVYSSKLAGELKIPVDETTEKVIVSKNYKKGKTSESTMKEIIDKYYTVDEFAPILMYISKMSKEYTFAMIDVLKLSFHNGMSHLADIAETLILNNPPEFRSNDLFEKFYEVASNLSGEVLTKFCIKILLNCNIWIESPDINKIVTYWFKIVQESLRKCSGLFVRLVYYLRKYFYIDKTEEICVSERSSNIDVIKCRKLICDCLAEIEASQSDLMLLVNECNLAEDKETKTLFLSALHSLFSKIHPSEEVIKKLVKLNIPEDEETQKKFLSAIFVANDSIFSIKSYMLEGRVTNISCIISYIKNIPNIAPYALKLAILHDSDTQKKVTNTIEECSKNDNFIDQLQSDEYWYLWPFLFAIQTPIQNSNRITAILANADFDCKIISFLGCLAVLIRDSLSIYIEEKVAFFFWKIFELFIAKNKEIDDNLFIAFIIILRYRFSSSLHSYQLIEEYNKSPFSCEQMPNPKRVDRIATTEELRQALIRENGVVSITTTSQESLNQVQKIYIQALKKYYNSRRKQNKLILQLLDFDKKQFNEECMHQILSLYNKMLSESVKTIKEILKAPENTQQPTNQTETIDVIKNYNNNEEKEEIKTSKLVSDLVLNYMNEKTNWNKPEFLQITYKRTTFYNSLLDSSALKRISPIKKKTAKVFNIEPHEYIQNISCKIIKIGKETSANLLLKNDEISILTQMKEVVIPVKDIDYVLPRSHNLNNNSVEIYTDNKSYLLSFDKPNSSIISTFKDQYPSVQTSVDLNDALNKWYSNTLSNFMFLMLLNIAAGRSFHDMNIYPIFPWVMIHYLDEKLDFDSCNLRNLSQHVVCVHEKTKNKLEEMYKQREETEESGYYFDNYPINEAIVAKYLKSFDPIRSYSTVDADTKFDIEKLINDTLKGNDTESVPEFYSFLEIMNGREVAALKFCESFPELVYLKRTILESQQVTKNLHEWINLMFGVHLSDGKSRKYLNIYNPFIYLNRPKKLNDILEGKSEMYKCILASKGTVPIQIFTKEVKQNMCNETQKESAELHLFKGGKYSLVCSGGNTAFFADSNGEFRIYEINLDSSSSKLKVEGKIGFEINNKNCNVGFKKDKYYVFCLETSKCVYVKENGNVVNLHYRIKSFNIDDDIISFANANGTIAMKKRIISITHNFIVQYCVSHKHDRLVILSDDGFINVYTLRKASYLSSYSIGKDYDVKRILITDTFGIIVVISEREIITLTVNGFFIKKESIPFSIDICSTYSMSNIRLSSEETKINGVDRICFSSSNDENVYAFDVMFPRTVKKIITTKGFIGSIRFDSQKKIVTVITTNGYHYVLPVNLL